jgi:hypothetical protein
MMKSQDELPQSMNMFHIQLKKYSISKQAASARQVAASRFHGRRDDHMDDMNLRSVSRHHHFQGNQIQEIMHIQG